MLGFISIPGGTEWVIILIIALLLFGRRLPSVMRSMGKGVSEFKRGLHDMEDEINSVGEGEEEQQVHQLPEGESGADTGETDTEETDASKPAG